jgi:hypothetical protein
MAEGAFPSALRLLNGATALGEIRMPPNPASVGGVLRLIFLSGTVPGAQ